MATIDEDRSLEQLFFTTSLSCDAARNRRCAIKSRKEEWQRNCLEKRSIREMSSWIIYGFRALVKKLGFHCKWCKSARSIPFKIEPYIISWNDYYAISIYISSFKAINRQFFFSSHFASCHPSPLESASKISFHIKRHSSKAIESREILHKFIDFKNHSTINQQKFHSFPWHCRDFLNFFESFFTQCCAVLCVYRQNNSTINN